MRRKILGELSAINILMLLFVFFIGPFLTYQKAEAASLSDTMMRLDRMSVSALLSGTTCAKISDGAAGTEAKVVLTFPTGFAPGTAANFTINTAPNASWPTIGTTAVWIGINSTATTVSGTAVTIVSGNLTSTAPWYCFNFTSTGGTNGPTTNPNQIGTVTTQTSGSGTIDTANYAVALVDSGNDTITITATVPPTFSFLLSGTADTFTTNLSTTVALTSGKNLTVGTNAANGWTAWVKSANAGLTSVAAASTIATFGTLNGAAEPLTVGNYGYVLDVAPGAGTPTIAGEYDGNSTDSGGTLSTSFQQIASGTIPTAGDVVTLKEMARVTTSQKAASDYSDVLTVVAAGLY